MKKHKLIETDKNHTVIVKTLLQELGALPPEVLSRPANDGGWSILQNLHHLLLSEKLSLQYVRKKLSFNPELPNAGLNSFLKGWAIYAYMNLPIKFKAPKLVAVETISEIGSFKEISAEYLAIRAEWAVFFADLPEKIAGKALYKHPFAGKIGFYEMINFFTQHLQRHKKQIARGRKNGAVD